MPPHAVNGRAAGAIIATTGDIAIDVTGIRDGVLGSPVAVSKVLHWLRLVATSGASVEMHHRPGHDTDPLPPQHGSAASDPYASANYLDEFNTSHMTSLSGVPLSGNCLRLAVRLD